MPNDDTITAEQPRSARVDDFALYPPRGAQGLDPDRPDSFAQRLADLHRHHGSLSDRRGKGGLFILDIGELRRRFANRWGERREKAYQLIEGCLERHLGRHDLYLAVAADRFLVMITDIDRAAAERQARRIGQEITDRLCGMIPGGVACRVETTTIDLTVLLAGVTSLEELEARLAASAPADKSPAERQAKALVDRLEPRHLPIWNAGKNLLAIDALLPASADAHVAAELVGLERLPPGGAADIETIAALDGWAVATAAGALRSSRRAVLIKLHYATLASMRHRQQLMLACRRLPERARGWLLIELEGLPGHLPQARVRELVSYIRPFAVAIILRLEPVVLAQARPVPSGQGGEGSGLVAQLSGSGVSGVSLDLTVPVAAAAKLDVASALAMLSWTGHQLKLRTLCRTDSERLRQAAIAARVDYIACSTWPDGTAKPAQVPAPSTVAASRRSPAPALA